MVQILIHGPPQWPQDPNGPAPYPDELFLLELQGTLETSESGADALDGQPLGTIEWQKDKNKGPVLRIGHHRLEGKLTQLPQPFAVIRKRALPPDDADEEMLDAGASDDAHFGGRRRRRTGFGGMAGFTSSAPPSSTAPTAPASPSKDNDPDAAQAEYDVLTIVRYKYLFKSRPEIVVGEASKTGNLVVRPKT
ncbi:Ctf8-domain-containing protein [Hyaloraphidium curvatum]|nr:Ctf8-domain-containing protein [Hyaloraphidium curvatum]